MMNVPLHRLLMGVSLAAGLGTAVFAQAPDNTKVNTRDRATSERTADQAKNNSTDLQIMKNIRQSVVGDKSLSTKAHNVKIIAEHGKVTLKGPVETADEIKNIEAKAVAVAGAGNVTNQLEAKASKVRR
jgi:hyperosmotically inducible protein